MDLSYFQTTNENNETVIKTRPEHKSLSELKDVLSLGKPQRVIDIFINLMLVSDQWQWFTLYNDYLTELKTVSLFNSDLPVVDTDENGGNIYAQPKAMPPEPIRPALLTLDEYKANNKSLFSSYLKKQGVEINGHKVSLNKDNADGLVSIKTGYDLAGDAVFPTNFIADKAKGTVAITFNDFAEFTSFALKFLTARGSFFK